jgi:formylmethanofuran dehydrogenase subunit E
MRTLEEDLAAARTYHGHLCHGMVMGVRMARYGCRVLDIDDPRSYRDLLVYVEMDRCASDAVGVVAGVTLGRRRLKWMDYGKMAATFVDLASGRAVRLAPRPEVPHAGREQDPLVYWNDWSDEQLFTLTPVQVDVPATDMPGRPIRTVECARCGEKVQDGREVVREGETLCRACSGEAYYKPV